MKCQHEWAKSSTCLGGTAFARWLTCTKCGTTTPKIEGNEYPEPPAVELDVTDNPNWDLEIPLVMGAVERGALAHRIRAWGAQQFAAGKAAALAELHPHYEAEKERADRLQAQANEAAFDKLLTDPAPCSHAWDCDQLGFKHSIWRCSKCGEERKR